MLRRNSTLKLLDVKNKWFIDNGNTWLLDDKIERLLRTDSSSKTIETKNVQIKWTKCCIQRFEKPGLQKYISREQSVVTQKVFRL